MGNKQRLREVLNKIKELEELKDTLKEEILDEICPFPVGSVIEGRCGKHVVKDRKLLNTKEFDSYDLDCTPLGKERPLQTLRVSPSLEFAFKPDHFKLLYNNVDEIPPKKKRKKLELPIKVNEQVTLVEQETLPQRSKGIDWGVERKVVARKGDKKLFWVKGHTAWAGIGRTEYYQGNLGDSDNHSWSTQSGKLKEDLVLMDDKIKEFFGIDFSISEFYKAGTTIEINERTIKN